MNSRRRIAPFAAVVMLGAATIVHASIEPCDKNHYILSEQCALAAIDSAIGSPGAVAVDAKGNVYFSSPNLVFKMDAQGWLTRVAGNGTPGFSGDGGPATEALLNFPKSYPELENDPIDFMPLVGPLALDAAGNLYIGDAYNNRVRRVDANGLITTVVGDGLWWPQGVAIDAAGMLLVSDGTGVLRRIALDGAQSAMTANNCGKPRSPGLCAPQGIAADALGNVYVADGWSRVRRVSTASEGEVEVKIEVVTVAGALAWPYGVAVGAGGSLLIADSYNHCIRKFDGWTLTTVAGACGPSMQGYSGDGGPANEARLALPYGVAVDAAGNLFIADSMNQRIRKVTPDGVIHTIAGNGNAP